MPENRNSGNTPMRMINGNDRSLSSMTEYAASGAQNAAAHRPTTGIASTPQADGIAPSNAATSRNGTAPTMVRSATQST